MPPKRKKTDYSALASPFMKIPRMKTEAARSLLNAGISEIYHLQGRSADSLFNTLLQKHPDTPHEHLSYFRMAVYFAETPEPEQAKLYPSHWENPS